jgi:dUTPase
MQQDLIEQGPIVVTFLCRSSEHACIQEHRRLVQMSVLRVHFKLDNAKMDPSLTTPHI